MKFSLSSAMPTLALIITAIALGGVGATRPVWTDEVFSLQGAYRPWDLAWAGADGMNPIFYWVQYGWNLLVLMGAGFWQFLTGPETNAQAIVESSMKGSNGFLARLPHLCAAFGGTAVLALTLLELGRPERLAENKPWQPRKAQKDEVENEPSAQTSLAVSLLILAFASNQLWLNECAAVRGYGLAWAAATMGLSALLATEPATKRLLMAGATLCAVAATFWATLFTGAALCALTYFCPKNLRKWVVTPGWGILIAGSMINLPGWVATSDLALPNNWIPPTAWEDVAKAYTLWASPWLAVGALILAWSAWGPNYLPKYLVGDKALARNREDDDTQTGQSGGKDDKLNRATHLTGLAWLAIPLGVWAAGMVNPEQNLFLIRYFLPIIALQGMAMFWLASQDQNPRYLIPHWIFCGVLAASSINAMSGLTFQTNRTAPEPPKSKITWVTDNIHTFVPLLQQVSAGEDVTEGAPAWDNTIETDWNPPFLLIDPTMGAAGADGPRKKIPRALPVETNIPLRQEELAKAGDPWKPGWLLRKEHWKNVLNQYTPGAKLMVETTTGNPVGEAFTQMLKEARWIQTDGQAIGGGKTRTIWEKRPG